MDIGYIITVLSVILVSMMLHELMHGLVAYWLGDQTARLLGRLTLNPAKHIDPFLTIGLPLLIVVTNALTGANTPIFGGAKPVPFNPANIRYGEWGVALMAIAGPLTNLIIAFFGFGILALTGMNSDSVIGMILTTTIWVNLGFFAFNMLPIPPLDGSRVLYALAPDFVRKGMDAVERYGTFFVFLIVILLSSALGAYLMFAITWILRAFAYIFGVPY